MVLVAYQRQLEISIDKLTHQDYTHKSMLILLKAIQKKQHVNS